MSLWWAETENFRVAADGACYQVRRDACGDECGRDYLGNAGDPTTRPVPAVGVAYGELEAELDGLRPRWLRADDAAGLRAEARRDYERSLM
jgi:hypothetical protein